ncbi:TPA: thioesterase [Proteus mirabilis]|nr:thioesterase [Proteus mirabilis]HCT1400692.1 thioesterase [Proteus mirabilis]HCT1959923.1 thioesterase [Proteus mirabilis]
MIKQSPKYITPLNEQNVNKDNANLLVCPFAGASNSAFNSWRSTDISGLNCQLVNYSGHGCRFKEPAFNDIGLLANELITIIKKFYPPRHNSLLLCGHSMGAQVAFETAIQLEKNGWELSGLILSGCQAPHIQARRLLSDLNDDDFIQQLIAIGGCDAELIKQPQLLKQFMPLLRADFLATERYFFQKSTKRLFHTPVLLMYGSHDSEADKNEVEAWQDWIDKHCTINCIAGDHFYPITHPNTFCRFIIDFYHQFIND